MIEPEPRARGGILATVAMAAILAPLNSTMIAVAQPGIIREFNSSVGAVGWLVTSYLLALAVVQPIAGKLGDRYGRRPFVLGGLLAFGLASLGAAVAQKPAVAGGDPRASDRIEPRHLEHGAGDLDPRRRVSHRHRRRAPRAAGWPRARWSEAS